MPAPTIPPLMPRLERALLLWIREGLKALPPYRPAPLRGVTPIGERDSRMIYLPQFPDVDANDRDVVTREVTVLVVGEPDKVLAYPHPEPAGGYTQTFEVPEGVEATLTLVHIDDAGNRSVASDPYTFTATDTLPPAKPGALGVTAVGE